MFTSYKGMLTKSLCLLLGYIVSIFCLTKGYPHFDYNEVVRIKESSNYLLSTLICYEQTYPFYPREGLLNHYSHDNLINNHSIFQTHLRQKNVIWSDRTFKNIREVKNVIEEINPKGSDCITTAPLSLWTKSVFQNSGAEAFIYGYLSRQQFVEISTVVRNATVNVTESLPSFISCVQLKEDVSLLFIWSDMLLDYVGSRHFPTKITLHRTSARIIDERIFYIISNVTNVFNIIEHIFSNCILSQGKETVLMAESSFLWFKVDDPYSFQNMSGVFQKQSSFFKITPQLQEELAKKPGLISVQFMTSDNLVRFSYKNFVSVGQLMLLSIKKGGEHFENLSVPIDLFFKYKISARSKQLFQGTAHTPPNYEPFLDKENLVSVYKLMPFHFPGSGKIIIKFYNLKMNSLKVAVSTKVQPDWESMTIDSTVITEKYPIHETTMESQTVDSIYYLGITSANTIPGTIEYSFEVRYFQCYSKFGIEWKSDGCEVGSETNETIIHCKCRHLSLFGGGVAIAPRQVDFRQDIKFLYLVNENPMPCILVASILLIYLLVLVWTRHNDSKDRLQRFVVVLDDNFPGEEWPYLLTVYTSFWIGSGTEANVGVRLYGKRGISRIHILTKLGQRKVLKSNCDDWFLIFTPKNLGVIEKIHIFSDFTGFNPDWYCRKMMLYDLEGQREYKFVIEKWVSLAEEDECVDFFCYPTPTKKSLRRDRIAMDNIIFGLQETHLLFSIFTRHPRSSVTRSQRLSICICILLVHLLTSNIFHESELPEFPQYSTTKRKLVIQMESTLVASPFTFIVIFCFKKSRIITAPKNDIPMTLTSTQAVPLETGLEVNQKKKSITQPSESLTERKKETNESTISSESSEEDSNESEEDAEEEEGEEEEVEEEEEEEKEIEEGCLRNCYNQIRALVFQVIVSKTIMPVKIAEEDEKSAHIRIRWMYFAWTLCEFAIFGSAFFTIIYSLKMKSEVCREWMGSSMKYSLMNIILMAPLKITVFALILAGLYGQLHYIPSYECNTEAAVKRKLIGNKKFLSRLLRIRKHKCYKPLNSKQTQDIRSKQKNWRRWRILINFFVTAFLFIVIIFQVEFVWKGLYVATEEHYHNMFDPRHNHKPIDSFKSYINYLTNVVIPAYDKTTWYNGAKTMSEEIWNQESNYMKDHITRLVGLPRLRQQRVKPEACVMPAVMVDKLHFQQCYSSMTWSNIDERGYAVTWTKPEKLIEDSDSPWVFSDSKNSPPIICGHKTAKCYRSGGYTAKLTLKEQESKSIINDLMKEEWFDGLTRVLFFETVVYNVNSDLLSSVQPMLEKLADGSFYIHINIISLRPHVYGFISVLSMLLCFTFYYFIRIVLLFNRKGLKYLLSATGLLDVFLSILMYATMVSVFFNRSARIKYLHSWQLQQEIDLQIRTDIYLHRSLMKYETSVVLILIPVQLFHNFRFGKRFFCYFKILLYCSKYAVGIALTIAMFYLFSVLLSAVNNSKPIQCLFNRSYNHMSYCTRIYSLDYYVELLPFIIWVTANIATFVACVTTIYGYKWMKEQNKYAVDFNMVTFLWGKLKKAGTQMDKFLIRGKKVINLSPKRIRAGADTIDLEEEDVLPRNRSQSYTKIMLSDMNMKFDTILEKLRKIEKSSV